MKFISKTEAYSYTIVILEQLKAKKLPGSGEQIELFNSCITKLKVSFENHEQNPKVVVDYLEQFKLSAELTPEEMEQIDILQNDLVTNDYTQTVEEKYQNPLARRAESELPILLLQRPTPAMMTSVKRVSDELLKLIDDQRLRVEYRLFNFREVAHVIALGALPGAVTVDSIKKILQENDPTKLAEIMHIHFKFAQGVTRELPVRHAPCRNPVGRLAEVVKLLWRRTAEHKDFFAYGLADLWEGKFYRSYISDELMYRSDLYTAPGRRGRGGSFDSTRTHQLGLMLTSQKEFEKDLPTHPSSWAADCKSQPANYSSPYVLDLVENDAVYVAGPSGMTSMFLSQMEILANFEDENLKKNYLSAVVAYIVGGGFHSLHEVIGPAQYALGLVPGYHIQVPSGDKRAPAPNYNQFFAQQEAIDPDFSACRALAWQHYLNYVNDSYLPRYMAGFVHQVINVPSRAPSPPPPNLLEQMASNVEDAVVEENNKVASSELKEALLNEINNYIQDGVLSRGNRLGSLSFITRIFRNSELTKKKLEIAMELKAAIQSSPKTIDELKNLIKHVKKRNLEAEHTVGKTYGVMTKSGLNRTMESIENLISSFESDSGYSKFNNHK